jgi:GntR family transcriptional regulator
MTGSEGDKTHGEAALHAVARRINRGSQLPFYSQLREILLDRLANEWMTGDKLPSEADLCSHYEVSRTVVRQAVDQLANEGLIVKVKGVGAFVADRKVDTTFIQRAGGFYDEMVQQGRKVTGRVLEQRIIPATVREAAQLEIPIGADVVQFDRVRYVDEMPAQVVHTRLPAARFPGFEAIDMTDQSLYHILASRYDCRPATGRRRVEARSAEPAEASLLEIPAGAPVLVMQSLTRDARQQPFEWFVAVYRADRFQFDIKIELETQ